MKCIVLLALVAILRPSDIAPCAVVVKKSGVESLQFTANRIDIDEENSIIKLRLLGIKNDYERQGFEVVVRAAQNKKLCPIVTMQAWLHRTWLVNPDPRRPVFAPLNYPFSSLSSCAIAAILNKAIKLVGLANQGFTAKSFRLTGATVAIQKGVNLDMVQRTGRWRSTRMF